MVTHVKLAGILHIVLGAMGIVAGLVILAVFGGIAGIVGFSDHSSDGAVAIPILGVIGTFIFLLLLALSLPSVIAGFGLLAFRPWARILTIVLSVLHLLNFPFGTALGVYSLWALLAPETALLFHPREPVQAYRRA
ncbi:MAG: hypothetical protein ACR2NN_25795 [Bryobacteraceae bacterium]